MSFNEINFRKRELAIEIENYNQKKQDFQTYKNDYI